MSPEAQVFEFEREIKATPTQVYLSFTNATQLRGWLCDVATLNPKPGGRIYLAWNSGYYMAGEYLALEPPSRLVFTWYGRGEPGQTRVTVNLYPTEYGTQVKLAHSEIKNSPAWMQMVEAIAIGWENSLENLASRLETGADLRIMKRPMLGITLADLDQQQADSLGVPTTQGIRLDDVLEGLGAQKAGLKKNDVIIAMNDQPVSDFANLSAALNGKRAGDHITVVYYRGAEKRQTDMELSSRPMPDMPTTTQALAEIVARRYADIRARLEQVIEGISEAEASFKPAADQWNVKEVMAHLIHGERDEHAYVTEIIGNQERWSDDDAGNLSVRTNATLAVLPTLQALHEQLLLLYSESVALYQNIPADLAENDKGTFWRLAFFAVQPPYHEYSHFEQIKATINAARQ